MPTNLEYSGGKQYAVRPDGSEDVFSKVGAVRPRQMKRSPSLSIYKDGESHYERNVPKHFVKKDCLEATEESMADRHFHEADVRSQVTSAVSSIAGRSFGDSDEKNVRLAARASRKNPSSINHQARAEPGQGLVTVRMTPNRGKIESPYHAAFVAARDGKDVVVLEVSAGTTDGLERDVKQEAFLFKDGDQTKSFHAGNLKDYGRDAVTLPIEFNGNTQDSTVRQDDQEHVVRKRKRED